jgi:cytochrome P450
VDAVLGSGPAGRPPRWSDYAELTWTRQVLDETLRLYPPAWVVTRRALADDVLAGVEVPEGSLVILCTYALHRHPSAWPDPERFDPARFDPDRRGELQRTAYAPFGSGPRLCIGRDFALLEGALLLARISQRYVLRPASRRPVETDALVTIRPRQGLVVRLERRPS